VTVKPQPGARQRVLVAGGGLAGMTAALRLAERGIPVTLLEASGRLGGMAGAEDTGHGMEDHGYHIFPMWYLNTWRIIAELGIESSFRDCHAFHQVVRGEWPRIKTFRDFTSTKTLVGNLRTGLMPVTGMLLYYMAAFDLMAQSYSRRALLDLVSVTGFLRSRFYRSEKVAEMFQSSILGGISAPSYEASAMTIRNVLRAWMRYPEPMFRILRGDLQTLFIDPFERRLVELGCEVRRGCRVTGIVIEEGRVAGLQVEGPDGPARLDATEVVLALPADAATGMVDGDVFEADPELGAMHDIKTRPMAAFTLAFEERIPGIPPDHVNLLHSSYGLSFIDVAQTWPGLQGTVLSCIASAYTRLIGLEDDEALDEMTREMVAYIPSLATARLSFRTLQAHLDAPLVMNDVGAWGARPRTETAIPGLTMAGAQCRNHVDLITMEAAVTSGLHAAEAVRARLRAGTPVKVEQPHAPPQLLLTAGRLLMVPAAAVVRVVDAIVG
jgi:phytoene dehydrogenase-like protein